MDNRQSPITKQKRVFTRKNNGEPWHSEQTKLKMSKAQKGKKISKERISGYNKWKKGIKLDKEHRKKISLGMGGDGIVGGKELTSWKKNKRNRLKRASNGFHTWGEWQLLKKQYGFICPCCKKQEPKIKLTEDHIIPLSKGGSDYIENIQPLCMPCNAKKHTDIIKY